MQHMKFSFFRWFRSKVGLQDCYQELESMEFSTALAQQEAAEQLGSADGHMGFKAL